MCDTASVLEEVSHSRMQSLQTSRPREAVSGLWGAEKRAPGRQPRRNRSSRGSANTVRQAPGPSGTNHTAALHSGVGAGMEAGGVGGAGTDYRGAGPKRSRVGIKSPPGLPGLEDPENPNGSQSQENSQKGFLLAEIQFAHATLEDNVSHGLG